MKKLIEENYKSIVKRGLINNETTNDDFIEKLNEEVREFSYEVYIGSDEEMKEELADVILVCLNFAKHNGIDIEKELKRKIQINFKR